MPETICLIYGETITKQLEIPTFCYLLKDPINHLKYALIDINRPAFEQSSQKSDKSTGKRSGRNPKWPKYGLEHDDDTHKHDRCAYL